jgi:hypothetical protein
MMQSCASAAKLRSGGSTLSSSYHIARSRENCCGLSSFDRALGIDVFPTQGRHRIREPFLGGGSMFIYARRENLYEHYWINDANPRVFAFWQELQRDESKAGASFQ